MNDKALANALGLQSSYGFHVEEPPRPPAAKLIRQGLAQRWYPCIEEDNTYTGCLGEDCPLEVCWTDTPSTSYAVALRRHFRAAAADYVPGAQCLQCRHVQQIAVEVIDGRRGVISLPMLRCVKQCWQNPISASAFVRRRIPPEEGHDLADCPLFDPARAPIDIVEQHRLQLNDRVRARRSARAASGD